MERRDQVGNRIADGVLLLDRYDESADMLKQSFRLAGFGGPVVVLADEGFLPADVLSLFRWFCTDVPGAADPTPADNRAYRLTHAGWRPGKPRYFNQIELPDYWEISGNNGGGEVHDLNHLRGRIFYGGEAGHRLVSEVDWLNEQGVVRCTDHYDRFGALYARTVFNRKGERFCRSWFDGAGRERVVENDVTHDILVNRRGRTEHYRNRTALAVAMLRELGAEGQRIFYNSLSTPLFVSEQLQKPAGGNVLFWQEEPRDDIPGNMQMIFDGASNTAAVCVQNRKSLEKLTALGAPEAVVRPFGFVYPFERMNRRRRDVLICTNSDQIEQLETFLTHLPQMTFHIAAVTEMSSRLLAYGRHANVRLYPIVRKEVVDELFEKCDYYFDVNHGGEILSSVKRAFLNNQLILGLEGTLHRRRYTSKMNCFSDALPLCRLAERLAADTALFEQHLNAQREAAMSESAGVYRQLFSGGRRLDDTI
ncbi:MAG: accessory Sec system glycosylation chaperone GtfB [Eubacteriaceae bacterium]|uniref:UDP-N-acetylglucosamine--peptide N-acetylglucosaminyltransferase stabilizing protein GtfB n=1 Tax=Candidatus Pseudoramibacter fermentans TaxID=2594427 RepID=A0A6L5GPI5_9FIRM|nr:accessory Sec system glycosylation chaperone GtfB [Candidatus Pseudoramibacter fermentans]RRF92473.1 MAG: accessory Sec system glycosylation chaperone GtfB [Eubacteriaceae bacterium]